MTPDSIGPHIGPSRRIFLQSTAACLSSAIVGPELLAAAQSGQPRSSEFHATPGSTSVLSPHLAIFHGPIHVGIIRDDTRALLIDCGDGRVRQALDQLRMSRVEHLVFTHYHRDQMSGAEQFPAAQRGVPERERDYFAIPMDYWQDDDQLYRVYSSFRPDHLMPAQAMRVDRIVTAGDQFEFGPARVRVLDTPGHTDGSVSYLVEVDDKRVLFCGDLLAGDGRIWDLFSLQKGFSRGDQAIGGYHGFMGDRWRLADSLRAVRECDADLIVPSHGALIQDGRQAIDHLLERLDVCYENYVSISALRHYFPKLFADYAGRSGQMPIREGVAPPACLRHFGTTWMLVSETGAALVMDAGSPDIVKRLQTMLDDGEIKQIDGLWVTHYHFDHTDGILAFQEAFDCPCLTDERLADVLVRPAAWRLPCLAPDPIQVHQPLVDGHTWTWHEFKLTSYYFPGQTLYHAALLAERGDLRMLFVGDSHTPAGLDDYCAYNRNLLGPDTGFQYCLALIEKLKPTHMFNCHVDVAFTFNAAEIAFMRQRLAERERLIGELTPWPHANYATDPSWVRVDPYRQQLQPGQQATLRVIFTNHATSVIEHACRVALPTTWGGQRSEWASRQVRGKTERAIELSIAVPSNASPGRYVLTLDVQLAERELPDFTECLIDVT